MVNKQMDVRAARTVLRLAKECKSIMCELEVSVSSVSSVQGWSGTKRHLRSLMKACLVKLIYAIIDRLLRRLRAHGR